MNLDAIAARIYGHHALTASEAAELLAEIYRRQARARTSLLALVRARIARGEMVPHMEAAELWSEITVPRGESFVELRRQIVELEQQRDGLLVELDAARNTIAELERRVARWSAFSARVQESAR